METCTPPNNPSGMKCTVMFILVLFSVHAFAQKQDDIPEFGKIDKADLLLTQCDFDPNASAVVLFDVEEVFCKLYTHTGFGTPNTLTTRSDVFAGITRRVRIKILTNKGMAMANIKIPYFSRHGQESISDISAQTYNLDPAGNIVVSKLGKGAVTDQELTSAISEKKFIFPDVQIGSVIEYTYKDSGPLSAGLRDWHFQSLVPVKLSRYSLAYSPNFEVITDPICTLPFHKETRSEAAYNVQSYTMTNIPALRDEPYMSCESDYVQRVQSRIVAINTAGQRTDLEITWASIINALMQADNFGMQISKDLPVPAELEDSLKHIQDAYRKMCFIYRFVRGYMQWDGKNNLSTTDGVKTAWKQKRGNSAEVNLILINLLRSAKEDAHPILLSSRTNGRVNTTYPTNREFDKVMAYVLIGDQIYILDATDKNGSPKLIPWEVMYTDGLVIDKFDTYGSINTFKWGWTSVWDGNQRFRDVVLINASIDEQGKLAGDATIKSYEYSRARRMADLKKGKETFTDTYFTEPNPTVHIDSLTLDNEQIDTLPLAQQVWFSQKVNSSGKYKYFSTNLFTGLEKNPFTAEHRFSDVFFGANQKYTIAENIVIPDGYTIDAVPQNIRLLLPDGSIVFTREIQADADNLSIREELQINKPVFSVQEYDNFREFYKKLFDTLNEEIAIKKN
jgi:Domain of Unknown Function with PDB structure (DUF3857)